VQVVGWCGNPIGCGPLYGDAPVGNGRVVLVMAFDDVRHTRLLEWLTTVPAERQPKTKGALAEELGVSPRSLRDWQSKPDFVAAWEARVKEVAGSPERTQLVLEALFQTATDRNDRGSVSAAKLYLEAVNAISPPKMNVQVTDARKLSDEELNALIAERAQQVLVDRGVAER
jgi:hypothetical protein